MYIVARPCHARVCDNQVDELSPCHVCSTQTWPPAGNDGDAVLDLINSLLPLLAHIIVCLRCVHLHITLATFAFSCHLHILGIKPPSSKASYLTSTTSKCLPQPQTAVTSRLFNPSEPTMRHRSLLSTARSELVCTWSLSTAQVLRSLDTSH